MSRAKSTIGPRRVALAAVASLVTGIASHARADDVVASRVASAERLVDRMDLSRTDYAHGAPHIAWTEPVAAHADCSGFVDELLAHDDGYTPDDFRRWFGSRRPTAERYHDAIVDQRGFERIATVDALRPGDFIAIKYLTRHDNTGHIMLVVEAPRMRRADLAVVPGTVPWSVAIVDSSESGHGPTDTRHARGVGGRDHDGLGRGVVRLYATADGRVAGFSWSTSETSRFVAPADEDVVLGRLVPGFRP